MRFMILRKADKKTEAGVLPDERLLAAFERYNAEGVKAGVLLAGEGLQPSSKGARVKFSGGRPVVTDGPFAEAKELVAGFGMIEVKSKEEAIEWVKRWPVLDGDGEVEIEIREVGCPGGLVGVSPSGSAGTSNRDGASSMRFMILLKADEEAEADFIPEEGLLAAMAKRNEEAMRAGVMLAGEGGAREVLRRETDRYRRTLRRGEGVDRRLLADPGGVEGRGDRMGQELPLSASRRGRGGDSPGVRGVGVGCRGMTASIT